MGALSLQKAGFYLPVVLLLIKASRNMLSSYQSPMFLDRSQSNTGSLQKLPRDNVLNNPFLALSSQSCHRLKPACPGIRNLATSVFGSTTKLMLRESKAQRRPNFKIGSFKLQPIQVFLAPSPMHSLHGKESQPVSPRPIKTPSFSGEAKELPTIRRRKSAAVRQMPELPRYRGPSLKASRLK